MPDLLQDAAGPAASAADNAADNAADSPAGAERRSRLRQYQVQLLERVQAAKNGAAVSVRELGVLLGGHACLLDLTQIGEIAMPQALAPVPLTRDWYLGLANIRGNLTGVIDLARYQALAPPVGAVSVSGVANVADVANVGERRLVTLAPHLGFNCALLAERVLGLRKKADAPGDDGGINGGPQPGWCSRHFQDADGQRWIMLDLAQLVREARFLQVGW
jgi:twitching motility protein PilI